MSAAPPEPASLLAHAGFLQGLAARLVADPATADDVVQETWLAAVRRPPEPREGVRGWLATVARNAARMARRSSSRRAQRERRAARSEGCPSPDEILGREAARRGLVEAVLRLDPQHRDVIVLRFYEGLAPRDVAARLSLPVETVRTRTRRAIARLREDLDRRHGERASWALALAPLARLHPADGALALGGTLMSSKSLVVLLLVAVALTAGSAWLVLGGGLGGGDSAGPAPVPSTAAGDAAGEAPALAGRGPAKRALDEARGDAPAADASRAGRPLGVLRGYVASGRTHAPIAGATVVARPTVGAAPDGFAAPVPPDETRTTTTDAEGRFVLEGVPVGAWRVAVSHPEEGTDESVGAAATAPPWLLLYPMPSAPGARDVAFRVVDRAGRPVAGARVELTMTVGGVQAAETSDAEGIARFPDVPGDGRGDASGWATATAATGTGRVAWNVSRRRQGTPPSPFPLVLDASGGVEGRVIAPTGVRVAGVVVEAWSLTGGNGFSSSGVPSSATADETGRYRIEGLPAGHVALLLRPGSGLRPVLRQREGANVQGGLPEYELLRATVEAGRMTSVDVEVAVGGRLEGRVVAAATSLPVAGARVAVHLPQGPWDYSERYRREGVHFWRLDSPWPDARRNPLAFRILATDAEGRYATDGLLPGPWRVTVVASGALAFDRREDVPIADGETTTLAHALPAGGTLELVAPSFASLGVRRVPEGTILATFLTPSGATGAATLPGLPVGRYELVHAHSDPAHRPIPVAEFEIRAGRTTYVDALDLGNHRVSARLLEGGQPVAGARVRLEGQRGALWITDEEGRFSWSMTRWGESPSTKVWVNLPRAGAPMLVAGVPLGGGAVDLVVPRGALLLRVRDVAGRPAPGASVTVRRAGPPAAAAWALVDEEARAVTGPDGTARVGPLPPGRYVVSVRIDASGAAFRVPAEVADGPAELPLDEPPTGALRIRVTDATGAPRADVRVSVLSLPASVDPGPSDANRWGYAEPRTTEGMRTGADGTILVRGLAAGLVRTGAWVMDQRGWMATENAQAETTVEAGRETEVVLTLAPVSVR